MNQLNPTVDERLELFCREAEVELELKDRLPLHADDLYTLTAAAFMAGEERAKSKAAIATRYFGERTSIRGRNIEEWRRAIQQLEAQRTPIDPTVAAILMLLDLPEEMPMTIYMLEDKVDSEVSLNYDRFMKLDEIIAKATKAGHDNR